MVTPNEIKDYISLGSWGAYGNIATWIGYILISISILAIFYGIFLLLQYKNKVTYFPLLGDSSSGNITFGKPKTDRGRDIKIRGEDKFRLLFARKTIAPIPFKYRYSDGIFLVRKDKDTFEPTPRPAPSNEGGVDIKPVEYDLEFWSSLEKERIRRRYIDEDFQKKQFYMMFTAIIVVVIFVGIVIWMSYAATTSHLDRFDTLATSLDNVASKLGIGGP